MSSRIESLTAASRADEPRMNTAMSDGPDGSIISTSIRQRIGDPGQFRTFIVGGDLLPVVEIEVKTAIAALRQENKLARAAVPGQSKTFLI
jgi:hypothetical protein